MLKLTGCLIDSRKELFIVCPADVSGNPGGCPVLLAYTHVVWTLRYINEGMRSCNAGEAVR